MKVLLNKTTFIQQLLEPPTNNLAPSPATQGSKVTHYHAHIICQCSEGDSLFLLQLNYVKTRETNAGKVSCSGQQLSFNAIDLKKATGFSMKNDAGKHIP